MDNRAKIQLSRLENELVNNTEWILTKRAIINKVYLFFDELHQVYQTISRDEKNLLAIFNTEGQGKISKGENYLGLPYVILDYPAIFKKENVFAIRTMFWWGNFFSITFHISGRQRMYADTISKLLNNLRNTDFYVCVNEDEWQHNFDSVNYIHIGELDSDTLAELSSKSFLKVSKKIDLEKWDTAPRFLEETYKELMEIIVLNFPAGEKVP